MPVSHIIIFENPEIYVFDGATLIQVWQNGLVCQHFILVTAITALGVGI